MTTSRLAALPTDHVVAEIAAFPLASEAALSLAITKLDPGLRGHTQALWREAERCTLGGFPAFSVDEAVAIRDHTWFGDEAGAPVPLHRYLRRIATQYLEARGPLAVPTLPRDSDLPGPSDGEPRALWARLAWRWLSFALPPDLFLAALATDGAWPEDIDLLTPALKRHLEDKGYAEAHLHIGAALEFPTLWVSVLRAVAQPGLEAGAFGSPGADLDEGRDLAPWLVRAAIGRYVLAAYLSHGDREGGNFKTFLNEIAGPRLVRELGAVMFSVFQVGLADLWRGKLAEPGPSFASLQSLYAELAGGKPRWQPFPAALSEVQNADPIAVFFPPGARGRPTPEMRFVAAGLGYLEWAQTDHGFAALFWQALRIRALFYRHVVQRPMTPGLQWFIRFYGRIKAGRRPIGTKALLESAARSGGAGQGLRSLEFRTSPETSRSESLQYLYSLDVAIPTIQRNHPATSRSSHSPLEFGLVLHWTKDRGGGALKGKPKAHWQGSHADPWVRFDHRDPSGRNLTGYRYAQFYNQKRDEALSLAWVLWHFPLSLGLLRGLDVCTDELGVPTWVLAPLLRYVREISYAVSERLRRSHGDSSEIPPLRMTAHTGEDFVHLLTGLRNVDEAVRRFGLREGDRLGHGVALGVDPRDWSQRAGRIPVHREDRLFDLAWEWSWYARERIDPPSGRVPMLEREIARLSYQIFGKPISPYDMEQFVEHLYDEHWLCLLGFPNGRPPFIDDERKPLWLLKGYLKEVSVFEAGRKLEWLDPSSEGEALAMLQAGLRQRLGQRGIAVEVNPSSNLLIGDLCDLTKHPLWRLRPPNHDGDAPPLSICIGSDDPLTFATALRQEYQWVHDALVLAGLSEAQACEWLEDVRETGLDYRFTLPEPPRLTDPATLFDPPRIKPAINLDKLTVRLPP